MAASEAQKRAIKKYIEEKTDEIKVRFIPQGRKAKIKAHAKKRGFDSLNAYINHLIEEDMKKEP